MARRLRRRELRKSRRADRLAPQTGRIRSLKFESLEPRAMLSGADTFSDAHPTLNLTLNTSANVSILSTGTSYSLTLSSGNWSGTDTANAAGNGSPTLVVTTPGLTALSTGINISDSGGAGDSITFADSQTAAYFNNFSITLNNASASALSFNGPTTFAGSAALTAAVNGSISINTGATAPNGSIPVTINMGTGGLSLAATGSNTALADSGNIASQGGAITLEATGTVTIASAMTVNATSGPITLAADVTSSGAGDDGVGSLSIASGATVQSTGAITLRGADVNIDTSSNPAVVGAARSLATTASATYSTGLNGPNSLAFDSSGNLYVTNDYGSTVEKFAPGSTTASATYSAGVQNPFAVAFDASGNLYVANDGNNTVEKFAPGSTTASATYSTGMSNPASLAIDGAGNLYVANRANDTVEKFAPGSTTVSATYSAGVGDPFALAIDASGNLYVANENNNTVEKFAPGSTTASATYSTGVSGPFALAIDASGNLYVANFINNTVVKFAPGSTTPSATYSGFSQPSALAIDISGNLYVANDGNNTVEKFVPGSTTASATYSAGVSAPGALAFDASGNLYVANFGSNTVAKFAPGGTAAVAASVTIQSSVESRPILVGGTNSSPVAGINLTTAELGQIFTTSTGLVTIGDAQQAGDITFSTATPVTTAGATLDVVQLASGAGGVVFDDGAGTAIALSGNGGSINITAGIGGITSLSASNGTAEIGSTGPSVTLVTDGPIGTRSNRIQFADDANTSQQIVSIGSTTIQPLGVYLDGLGSLTLDNVVAYAQSPTVDVTARTNLVLASGGTINSGSGPIVLGADLTAAETGDDGVGTLGLSSGSTVDSTGAITLRGADVNIDTSSNPAVVGAARSLGTTATATLTGLSYPTAVAVNASGDLFVTSFDNTVREYLPGATTATATLSGLSDPESLAFDGAGDLFVANFGRDSGSTVSEFLPGATVPSATLTGLDVPIALATDSVGDVFVANFSSNTVSEFRPGATTAFATLVGLRFPAGLALDASGDLFVSNSGYNSVSEFAPGATTAARTLTGLDTPVGLAFDASGDLFVSNQGGGGSGNTISEFAPGATTPTATLTGGLHGPVALAFDSYGNLYASNQGNYNGNSVSVFAPGSTTATATLTGLSAPDGLAFSGPDLYVVSSNNSTASQFSPASTTAVASSVTIQSSVESRPMLIGGANGSPVAGINLTSAELAQIFTTSAGLVTIGDAEQTGDVTFSAATPVTTAGGTLDVDESSSSGASIVLSMTGGTNLENLNGAVNLSPGTGGVQTTLLNATDVPLVAAGVTIASQPLTVNLGFTPGIGQQLTIIDDTAAPPASSPISGTFSNAAQGGILTTVYGGHTYLLQADYQGGDGNNLVLTRTVVPTQIVVTTEPPASVTARSPFGVTFTLEDADGNVATNYSGNVVVALSNNPGGSTLGGTTTVAVASGLAAFTDLTLNKAASGYTLDATAGTLTSADTSAISVAPGAATQLLITTEPPASIAAGSSFGVTFTLEDADGNVATSYSGNVVVALSNNPGGSTLGGTTTVAVSSGLAAFTDLTLNKAASGYTLDATAGTLTSANTSAISVTPGAATQLLITTEPPAGVAAGSPFGVTFTLEDADDNVATSYSGNVVVALSSNPGGSTLGGTTTVAVSSGLAAFTDLTLNKVASGYTLDATTGSLTSADTSAISVTSGAATQLLITTEPPASIAAGSPFGVTFTLEDADGNVATNYSGNVVVALSNNPGGSTLGGTTTVAVSSGVATFNDLTLNRAASGYTLDATAGMLTSANTSPIAVMPGQLTIAGAAGDSVVVRFLDAGDFSVTITNGGNTTSNTYSLLEFDKFTYNGPNGYSKVLLIDRFHSYTATQSLASTDAVTSGFEFVGNGIANLYVYAAGTATVNVTNGPDNDYYVDDLAEGYSYVADPIKGVYSELSGFGAQTVTGSGGTTYTYIYSASHAAIVLDPAGSTATLGGVTTTLGNFPQIYAVGASDGSDQVTLHSQGGNFVAAPSFSHVAGTFNSANFMIGGLYCANVTVQATNASDGAFFYSYPGNTFSGAVGNSSLTGSASAFASFSTFTVDATGFDGVTVLESGSYTDVANLTSPGGGRFVETSTVSTLTVGSTTITVNTFLVDQNQNMVPIAAKINVTGKHDGTDTAYLYDSAGTNALVVGG